MRALFGLLGLIAGLTAANGQETAPTCTNAGISYKVGELACIAACHGQRRMAKCEIVANAASWTYISDPCPTAMILMSPWPADRSEMPVVAAMSPLPIDVNRSAIALALSARPSDRADRSPRRP